MSEISKIKSNISKVDKHDFNSVTNINSSKNIVADAVDVLDMTVDSINSSIISINSILLSKINDSDVLSELNTIISKYYKDFNKTDIQQFLLNVDLDMGNYEEAVNSVINYYKLIPNGKDLFEEEFGFKLPNTKNDIEYSYLATDFYLYYSKKVESCDNFSELKSFDLDSERLEDVNKNFINYLNDKNLICNIEIVSYNEEYLNKMLSLNKFVTINTDEGIVTVLEINDDGSYLVSKGTQKFYINPNEININSIIVYDYLESITKNLNDSMPRYYQENYQNVPLGTSTVALGGCGFTAGAMIASYLTGKTITPVSIAEEFGNQYYIQDQGMSWEFPEALAESYNLGEVVFTNDTTQVIDALQKGEPVMCSQNVGLFTQGGHIIVLSGITNDGKILVHDPKYENSITNDYNNRVFDLETEIDSTAFCYWIFKGNKES